MFAAFHWIEPLPFIVCGLSYAVCGPFRSKVSALPTPSTLNVNAALRREGESMRPIRVCVAIAVFGLISFNILAQQTAQPKPQVKPALTAASLAISLPGGPGRHSQVKAAVPDAPPAAAPAPAQTVQPAMPPPLTHEEQLEFENLQLRATLVNEQGQNLRDQYAALVKKVEAEHPGFIYNPQLQALQPEPKPPVAPKAAKKPEAK